jgi:IS5 family transposase
MLIDHDALRELDDVHAIINWLPLEQLLSGIHSKSRGEKAWPPIMMFKALLLQSWYRLSDPGLEKQLARDLLFRRFVALDISESVPDHSTFWRFRQKLEQLSLMDNLLNEVNEQLADQGLLIKSGGVSIVDASVIEANQCRPNKDKDGNSTQDPGAGWNVKAGSDGKRKSTYGYKAHINVDEDGFIKATDYTAGNVHDSKCFTDMLSGDESSVYADSAYLSRAHNDWLCEREIENRIIKRAYRSRPLDKIDRQFNRLHYGVRCTVERVFGVLKQHYAMTKARYLGLGRNRTRFELMCVAHNMKRGLSIHSSCA